MTNINLYNFTRRVPCGVSLSTFELIPAVATAQPGALVTVPLNAGVATYFVDHLLNLGLSKINVAYFLRLCMKHRGDLLTVDIVDDLE